MNIVSIGCSWTYGHGLDSSETYSAHLQNAISQKKVINGGHSGADNEYSVYAGTRLVEEYNPAICIVQLTTFDRITLGTDGFENFEKNSYSTNQPIYYGKSENTEHLRVIGIGDTVKTKFTPGNYLADKNEKEQIHKQSGVSNNPKKFNDFTSVLYEDIVFSDFLFHKTINSLWLFHCFLQSKNIKPLYFSWLALPSAFYSTEYYEKIASNFIHTPVVDYLSSKNDIFIDNGYHLSNTGNKMLAEEMLLPRINALS